MYYAITLVIETEETDGDPGLWPWQEIIDSPTPVAVVARTDLPDDPTDSAVEDLHSVMVEAHATVARIR
jgi:hypothetical protein